MLKTKKKLGRNVSSSYKQIVKRLRLRMAKYLTTLGLRYPICEGEVLGPLG